MSCASFRKLAIAEMSKCLHGTLGMKLGMEKQEEVELGIRDKGDKEGKDREVSPRVPSMVDKANSDLAVPGLQLPSESAPRSVWGDCPVCSPPTPLHHTHSFMFLAEGMGFSCHQGSF